MQRQSGFTLYELLISMALLAILAILAMFGWRVQVAKARDVDRKESLHQLQLAFAAYRDDFGCYPPKEEVYCGSLGLDPYIPEVPCDPTNNDTYNFHYLRDECDTYYLYTKLEYENDQDITRLGCEDGCGPNENYSYYITSSDVAASTADIEGLPPNCGINANQCIPNVCSECCPGSNYRCNSAGNRCFYDLSCQ